ncbi:MAG: glycosyl hydrolase [Clostridia bacterium]|nr:glycosyl hydrolase [Clostridia bacterium]
MIVPSPLYKDPIYNGAADPMIIRKESDGVFYMFYTQRRANQPVEGVSFAYGTAIGVAESFDGAEWHYRGALDLDFEFGHNTFWAPEIIYDPSEGLYHMYVTYICGIYTKWRGKASIEHYTSRDLFYWEHIGPLTFASSRIIDPCLYKLPSGIWRMWYKDERQNSCICYADSKNLYDWEYRGIAVSDAKQEGPNVFELGEKIWLISDVWKGLAVYVSEDGEHFVRQADNILAEAGTRRDDNAKGAHADIFVIDSRAYIVYFTQPDTDIPERSSVHMAELKIENGILVCDRNAELDIDWSAR